MPRRAGGKSSWVVEGKNENEKLIFISLWGCFMPFSAWAGEIFIPLALPCFSLPYVIIPFILIEAAFLFQQLQKKKLQRQKPS